VRALAPVPLARTPGLTFPDRSRSHHSWRLAAGGDAAGGAAVEASSPTLRFDHRLLLARGVLDRRGFERLTRSHARDSWGFRELLSRSHVTSHSTDEAMAVPKSESRPTRRCPGRVSRCPSLRRGDEYRTGADAEEWLGAGVFTIPGCLTWMPRTVVTRRDRRDALRFARPQLVDFAIAPGWIGGSVRSG